MTKYLKLNLDNIINKKPKYNLKYGQKNRNKFKILDFIKLKYK